MQKREKWRRGHEKDSILLRNGGSDEHMAGRAAAAGLPHPAMAVWCRPGHMHTSQVLADSGHAPPSEDGQWLNIQPQDQTRVQPSRAAKPAQTRPNGVGFRAPLMRGPCYKVGAEHHCQQPRGPSINVHILRKGISVQRFGTEHYCSHAGKGRTCGVRRSAYKGRLKVQISAKCGFQAEPFRAALRTGLAALKRPETRILFI